MDSASRRPLCQYPALPTGCEATALAMLVRWTGQEIGPEEVARALPKEPRPFERNGRLVGGDPFRAFVGDPFDRDSFGVFHGPIAVTLERFLPGRGEDLTGGAFEAIAARVGTGIPAIVWTTLDLEEPRVTDRWEDVSTPGREIVWTSPEHCVLLVGADETSVSVHDPHTGRCDRHPRDRFVARWERMGRQAVTLRR